jgi:high-affinity Fe2+/Pb2+ permease
VVLVVSIDVGRPMHEGIGRTLLLVSPMVPFLLAVWAVVRQFRRLDEYGRLMSLESIAMAFGVTAGWVVTYGFMENVGYPRLSMFSVWMVMMSAWVISATVRCLAGR